LSGDKHRPALILNVLRPAQEGLDRLLFTGSRDGITTKPTLGPEPRTWLTLLTKPGLDLPGVAQAPRRRH